MGQFDTQFVASKSALSSIIQPTSDAIDALDAAAEAQYASDQASIAALGAQIASLNDALAAAQALDTSDEAKITALTQQIQTLTAQLATQANVRVFDALEYGPWGVNSDAIVGGSGLGTAGYKAPGVECAELFLHPQAPVPPNSNYFDCYFSQRLGADNNKTKFKLEASWLFPSSGDAAASQALEMEARQVVAGKMFVMALQLQFSGGQIRYWDAVKKWTAFGLGQTRLTPGQWYRVILEAHRDATTVVYDAVTINGTRTAVPFIYAAQPTNWSEDVKAALQLDGNGAGVWYRAKIDNVRLTTSQ